MLGEAGRLRERLGVQAQDVSFPLVSSTYRDSRELPWPLLLEDSPARTSSDSYLSPLL